MTTYRFVKIENTWTVSFKRRRSGRLLNITVRADSLVKACLAAALEVAKRYPSGGYREYGVSQTQEMQETWGWYGPPGRRTREWMRWGLIVETEREGK